VSEPPVEIIPINAPPVDGGPAGRVSPSVSSRVFWGGISVLALLCVLAVGLAWSSQRRVSTLERELVRRQQESQGQSLEARLLAKQAQDIARDDAAKVALLEARVTGIAAQREQLEGLVQSLARSRDENVLVDVDSAVRVALQQTAITGSMEPLVTALKQADERLARYSEPQLERVRRAIARDLDRARAVGVADLPALSIKLDEVARMIDELPLLAVAQPRKPASAPADAMLARRSAPVDARAGSGLTQAWSDAWSSVWDHVWGEVRSLVRVTRIDRPEAMLVAPEQTFFLRENVKLRLLNARLALFSRQFDTVQSDLQLARTALDRYFDHGSRRFTLANDLLRQVAAQARQVVLPRPDDTLAALAAATAAR